MRVHAITSQTEQFEVVGRPDPAMELEEVEIAPPGP